MIAAIKHFFATDERTIEDPAEHLAMAGALLLLEVACADFSIGQEERKVLRQRLKQRFQQSDFDVDALIDEALTQHDLSVSLDKQIDVINRQYDAEAKRGLIRDLWLMAFADGELHHYEEGAIRRLAELLYVPHRDFIQTKLEVTGCA